MLVSLECFLLGGKFTMISDTKNLMDDLNSPIDKVRLNAVRELGYSGRPTTELLHVLQKIKRSDKNKFVRAAAKKAIGRLNAVVELTGSDRALSELSDRELLERLLILQIENKKAISFTVSTLLFLFYFGLFLFWLFSKTAN
jgi:hypothetical protein